MQVQYAEPLESPPDKPKRVFFGTASYKFMSVKNTPLPQQIQFTARRSEEQSMPIVPQNAATTPAKNRLKRPSAQTPSKFIGKAVFICLVGSVNLVLKFQGMFFSAGWTPQNYST